MRRLVAATLLLSVGVYAFAQDKKPVDPGCPKIDPAQKDVDGMPFCPSTVLETSAWGVYRCAITQAKSFHVPTAKETQLMRSILTTYKQVSDSGIKPETTKTILDSADQLNLQVCRAAQDRAGVKDSFLLLYTKPGVNNYSGPFLMLRETKHSKVMLIGPHDDSDGTFADTKLALARSSAMVLVSNGHKRGSTQKNGGTGDFVHENNNLGTRAVGILGDLFKGYVWLHVHGMQDPDTALYRSREDKLEAAFIAGVKSATNIKNFNPKFNADFSVDSQVNSNFYLKTELPARIHQGNTGALAKIVKVIESNNWAW